MPLSTSASLTTMNRESVRPTTLLSGLRLRGGRGPCLEADASNRVIPGDVPMPTTGQFDAIVAACSNETDQVAKQAPGTSRDTVREPNRWDWGQNHERCAYMKARSNHAPPMSSLQHPDQKRGTCYHHRQIHDQFAEYLKTVYRIQPEGAKVWEKSASRYGEFVLRALFNDNPYTAEELVAQLERMKDIAAGFGQ